MAILTRNGVVLPEIDKADAAKIPTGRKRGPQPKTITDMYGDEITLPASGAEWDDDPVFEPGLADELPPINDRGPETFERGDGTRLRFVTEIGPWLEREGKTAADLADATPGVSLLDLEEWLDDREYPDDKSLRRLAAGASALVGRTVELDELAPWEKWPTGKPRRDGEGGTPTPATTPPPDKLSASQEVARMVRERRQSKIATEAASIRRDIEDQRDRAEIARLRPAARNAERSAEIDSDIGRIRQNVNALRSAVARMGS